MSDNDDSTHSCMLINEAAPAATLQDGICERLAKMEGVLAALMADDNNVTVHGLYSGLSTRSTCRTR
jgi:hypothetical protein